MHKMKNAAWFLIVMFIACGYFAYMWHRNDDGVTSIYAVFPMTGAFAEGGKNAQKITNIYFQDHPDSKLRVKYIDSESNPMKAVAALNQALATSDKPLTINVITAVSGACVPIVEERNGFSLNVCSLKTTAFDKLKSYQFLSYRVEDVVSLPAKYMTKAGKDFAVIYSDEEYGCAGRDAFVEKILSHGGNVVASVSYALNEADTRSVVEKALSCNPDGIFVVGVTTAGYLNIFRGIKNHGYKGLVCSDIVFSSPFIINALSSYADGVVFVCCDCDFEHPRTQTGRNFRTRCLNGGIVPYYGLVEIYDALLVAERFVEEKRNFSQESFLDLGSIEGCLNRVDFSKRGESDYTFTLGRALGGKIMPAQAEE